MTIAVVPFAPHYEAAARAFNERLRRANAPTHFFLPERPRPVVRNGAVVITHYVAIDETEQVRGGMICQEYPATVGGVAERVVNISAPLSEGIVDSAYTFVGPILIKQAVKLNPRAFVVGMGDAGNPLPRLLKAMGWTIATVPFYYRLLRPDRCVRQLGPLRATTARRIAGEIAARSGLASLIPPVVHRARSSTRGFTAEPIECWGSDADDAWNAFAERVSFGVSRTREVLPFFYPEGDHAPRAWTVKHNGIASGWFGLMVARMSANPYFGDLTVATLTDAVGTPAAVAASMALAIAEARNCGADILITNQQHAELVAACRSAGWREGPSNFLFAASRALAGALRQESVYLTRRDGDGLVNLS